MQNTDPDYSTHRLGGTEDAQDTVSIRKVIQDLGLATLTAQAQGQESFMSQVYPVC